MADDGVDWRRLRTRFQPIVDLHTSGILGYEALTAGPSGSDLEAPRALFAAARQSNRLQELELACWEGALRRFARDPAPASDALLFLNVLPGSVASRRVFSRPMLGVLEELGIDPERVVLEITEGTRIANLAGFGRAVAECRALGFRIALDDAGSGHSGLQVITELQPLYIKMDRSLVTGVASSHVKRAVTEAFLLLEEKLSSRIIAEGVERADDLTLLRELGIGLGQGYFLGRPYVRPAPTSQPARDLLVSLNRILAVRPISADIARALAGGGVRNGTAADSPRNDGERAPRPASQAVSAIAEPCPTVARGTLVAEALRIFEERGAGAVVIVEAGAPTGLLVRQRLYDLLGHLYGQSLYLRRPVESIADNTPLVVPHDLPVGEVSRRAMSRSGGSVYDDILVTREGVFTGIVSVRRILDLMTDLQLESALYANPLTGLPGNPVIEREIRSRADAGQAFALLHIDLDNFKAFNDVYGFQRGDEALRVTARAITDVVRAQGGARSFVGHIGGDDFLAIVEESALEAVGDVLGRRFDDLVPGLYTAADRRRGHILADGRTGRKRKYPLMTMTMAGVVGGKERHLHFAELLDRLSEVKRFAKARDRMRSPGSALMIDRRHAGPPASEPTPEAREASRSPG